MKLAEALMIRADYTRQLQTLRNRINAVAIVQEGEQPAEDPQELLQQVERVTTELAEIVQKINRTNHRVVLPDGQTLSDALATREMYLQQHRIFNGAASSAVPNQHRYGNTQIKVRGTLDVPDLRQRADRAAQAARELDARIQEANWINDLVD